MVIFNTILSNTFITSTLWTNFNTKQKKEHNNKNTQHLEINYRWWPLPEEYDWFWYRFLVLRRRSTSKHFSISLNAAFSSSRSLKNFVWWVTKTNSLLQHRFILLVYSFLNFLDVPLPILFQLRSTTASFIGDCGRRRTSFFFQIDHVCFSCRRQFASLRTLW